MYIGKIWIEKCIHVLIFNTDRLSLIPTTHLISIEKEYKWSISDLVKKDMKNEKGKIKERKRITIIFQILSQYKFYLPSEKLKVSNNFFFLFAWSSISKEKNNNNSVKLDRFFCSLNLSFKQTVLQEKMKSTMISIHHCPWRNKKYCCHFLLGKIHWEAEKRTTSLPIAFYRRIIIIHA